MRDDLNRTLRNVFESAMIRGEPIHNYESAWFSAPKVPTLLMTLAASAAQFEPAQSGMVGAALARREKLHKTAFIRGFAHLLSEEHNLALSTNIKKAIAIVATVILDDPNIDVTYDDVRHALEKLSK
jgi:hypothetical protein